MEASVTEANFHELAFDYFQQFYLSEFSAAADECPYDVRRFDDENMKYQEQMSWFMLERVQPSTGKTIMHEFAEKFVVDPQLRSKILQMENVTTGDFRITERHGGNVVLQHAKTGEKYTVELKDNFVNRVGKNVTCRIHPWGNIYKITGVYKVELTREDAERIKDAKLGIPTATQLVSRREADRTKELEGILIRKISTPSSILNKYPFQWIDGICKQLRIDTRLLKNLKVKLIVEVLHRDLHRILKTLPEESVEALSFLLENDGLVKYSKLAKKFDCEAGLNWNERAPTSAVGVLRSHGLVYVGKCHMGSQMPKVALIPSELRESLKRELANLK